MARTVREPRPLVTPHAGRRCGIGRPQVRDTKTVHPRSETLRNNPSICLYFALRSP